MSSCVWESVLLGVGRDCAVVAGVPSPARWPGPAVGRVVVLGCHGTALVLEALGGGTPCAPVADLGPWKAPFEGLLCSLAAARGPLPPWLLRFLAPKPLVAEPLSRGLPASACRPGAAPRRAGASQARCGLPSVSAAAGPAVVSCADEGPFLPPYAVRPPAPARVPARARVGSRPSAVALAAARCLRWWLVCGGVGLRPGSPRPRPRGSAAPAGPARAPPSGPPRCVCWGGWSRPSPLGAAAGVPSSAVAGPWPVRLARRLRAGEGRGERGASSRSPRRGPLRSVWGGVATAAAAARRRRVCPSVLGTSGPPGDLVPRPSWGARAVSGSPRSYLVDPASSICLSQRLSHACLSTHGWYSETANGSLNQLWFLWSLAPLLLG